MIQTMDYDVLIIGGGQAGVPLASALASRGKRVALVERKDLGGSCINFGCTPTKAAIASARIAHLARRGNEFGITIPAVSIDFPAVLERAQRIARESREGLDKKFVGSENPKLLRGQARLAGRSEAGFRVELGEQTVFTTQIVLNPGTRTLIPPIAGLSTVDFLDAGNWLHRPDLPAHLAIIGGGYIGLEMAQFYRRMGSAVTVLQHGSQVTDREDPDVAGTLQQLLESEGIVFHLNTEVTKVQQITQGVELHMTKDGIPNKIEATHIFVAVGRKPNTDDLGLETVGVTLNEHGIVQVDSRLATNIEGIWAAGDVRGGPQFTHTSWDDFRILKSQLLEDGKRTTDRIVPYAIFTDPELGRVGITETEARKQGLAVKVARFDMSSNGKAAEIGETNGFIKVVIDAATDRILGAAVLASEGAELVHIYVNIMNADAPYTIIRDAIQAHPTLSEAIQSAVSSL